jgi:bacillolysin
LSGQFHQYLLTKFNRNGVNGLGGTGDGSNANFLTNYTVVLANADGSTHGSTNCPGIGGYYIPSPGYVGICSGRAHDETVGHELGHLIAHARLAEDPGEYPCYETGALNESIADFFGQALERYISGSTDWLETRPDGTVVRSLSDPPSQPQGGYPSPDRYLSPDFYTGSGDGGGTHINSGIPSKAAYLAVEGGSFNGFDITGIGFDKVEQIWYRALTTYFQPGETFNDAYGHIIQAATDLYSAADVWEVTKALRSVEMHLSRAGLRGDYNGDGTVDGADYVVWRKGFGTYYTVGAFEDWRNNFGAPSGSGSAQATVPEPSAFLLVATVLAMSYSSTRFRPVTSPQGK